MIRTLNSEPVRPLTSREIAKVVTGILGGLVDLCGAESVCACVDFLVAHHEGVKNDFRQIEIFLKKGKTC